nr:citrate lyase acyl carrier protein [Raoultella sp. NCTC 9187]
MKIVQAAMAGTLESSDLMVKVSPVESGLDVVIQSEVYKQFGDRITEVVNETLAALNIQQGLIVVDDKGALDCVIRARMQAAAAQRKWPGKILYGKRYNEEITPQYVIFTRFKRRNALNRIHL